MGDGYEDLKVEREGRRAVITIDRPKVNALRAETFMELRTAFMDVCGDDEVWAVILTGAGEKCFSGGADLGSPVFDPAEVEDRLAQAQQMLDWVEEQGKPVIAALNGSAFGGGLELALACHFRLCDPGAKLGLTETNLGLMPAAGGTQRLARLVGPSRAARMIALGERVGAEEAQRIGLVDEVTEAGKVLVAARALSNQLAKRPFVSVKQSLRAVFGGLQQGLQEGLRRERAGFVACIASEDAAEGVTAFLEKRDPVWKGR